MNFVSHCYDQHRSRNLFYTPYYYWLVIAIIPLIHCIRQNHKSHLFWNTCNAFLTLQIPLHHYNTYHQCTMKNQQVLLRTTRFGKDMKLKQFVPSTMYSVSTIPKRKTTTTLSISNFNINDSDLEYHFQSIPFYDNYIKSSADTDFTHNWFLLSSSISSSLDDLSTFPITPFIVLIALTIGILANGWISRLISGDQGLGSYLSDGSGYNKSKFKLLQPTKDNVDRAVQDDPLPWLRLLKLDYVEVAGQRNERTNNRPNIVGLDVTNDNNNPDDSTIALDELELLRLRMQEQLLLGNINEAERLRKELERIMKDNNIQFTKESY